MKKFLETAFVDVRSSARTDVLHESIVESLCEVNPKFAEYDWEYEVSIPDGYSLPEENPRQKKFKIDIVGKKDGKIKICVLAKAMQSCIGKNMQNYTNTTIGESCRILYSPIASDIEKVLFVSFYPREAPVFTRDGSVKSIENAYLNKPKIDHILSGQFGGKVLAVDCPYDIVDLNQKRNVEDFQKIDIENLDLNSMIVA